MNIIVKCTNYSVFVTSILLAGLLCSCDPTQEESNTSSYISPASLELDDVSIHNDVDDIFKSLRNTSRGRLAAEMSGERIAEEDPSLIDQRFCDGTVVSTKNKVHSDPDTISVTFPETGCTDKKGNTRKGTITVRQNNQELTMEITTHNFYVNNIKVEGTRSVKLYQQKTEADSVVLKYTLENGKLTYPDDNSVSTRNSVYFEKLDINKTPFDPSDDALITLSSYTDIPSKATGTNRKGVSYEVTINSDLKRTYTCIKEGFSIPVSGIETIQTHSGTQTRKVVIDYGENTCDNKIKVTTDGQIEEKEISIKTGSGSAQETNFSKKITDFILNDTEEDATHSDVNRIAIVGKVLFSEPNNKLEEVYRSKYCENMTSTIKNKDDSNSDTLTITFAKTGCPDLASGVTRQGSVRIVERINEQESYRLYTITPIDYSINNQSIKGARTIKITDSNKSTLYHEYEMLKGEITVSTSNNVKRSSTRTTYVATSFSTNSSPSVPPTITILANYNGKATKSSGTTMNGISYTRLVKEDLIYGSTCPPLIFIPTKGKENITLTEDSNNVIVNLDYGNNECDNKVTLSSNGKSKDITIRSRVHKKPNG